VEKFLALLDDCRTVGMPGLRIEAMMPRGNSHWRQRVNALSFSSPAASASRR
jgi:hypothetical protein